VAENEHSPHCDDRCLEPGAGPRRAYRPPTITPLGEVRDVVLGTSPGLGDSAIDPNNFKF
jgi:hypothetical protein